EHGGFADCETTPAGFIRADRGGQMRVAISLTDTDGNKYVGSTVLALVPSARKGSGAGTARAGRGLGRGRTESPRFSLNLRAFMKTHAKNRSGPEKFTL